MTTSIDVLAVVDEAVATLRDDGNRALPGDLEIARAAVAELIEAAAPAAANDDYGMDADEIQRLINALAHVKGAKS